MLLFVLLISIIYNTNCYDDEEISWTRRSIDSIHQNENDHTQYIKVQNDNRYCLYDKIDVKVMNVPTSISRGTIMVGVSYDDKEEIVLTSIDTILDDNDDDIDVERCNLYNNNLIYCKDYSQDVCIPQTTDIIAKTNETHCFIEINFDKSTNEVPLRTTLDVKRALFFSPPLIGASYGEWISPTVLHLFVDCQYLNDLLSSFQAGLMTKIIANTAKNCKLSNNIILETDIENNEYIHNDRNKLSGLDRSKLNGRFYLYATERGTMNINLVESGNMSFIGKKISLDIASCDRKASFLPSLDKIFSNKVQEKLPASPTIRMKGVFGSSGKSNSLVIPDHSVSSTGTFSISFWIRLVDEKPTGEYRCLFHKSSYLDSSHRTPSAWLLPHTNRIALRVSTDINSDIGYDTTTIIPSNQWNLLTFVFNNISDSKYTAAVYINGRIDIEISFTDHIYHSNGPLYFFKDTSFLLGPRGFAKDVILWNDALTSSDVLNLYARRFQSSGDSDVKAVDLILDITTQHQLIFDNNNFYEKNTNPLSSDNYDDDDIYHEDGIATILLNAAKESQEKCEPFQTRLELYKDAYRHGSKEALYLWALMISTGFDSTGYNHCGVNSTTLYISKDINNDLDEAAAAFLYLFTAYPSALIPLSMMMFNGIGMKYLLNRESSSSIPFLHDNEDEQHFVNDINSDFMLAISKILKKSVDTCETNTKLYLGYDVSLGDNINCIKRFSTRNKYGNDDTTTLALGILFTATLYDVPEAFVALTHRYQYGINVKQDTETAVRYGRVAATFASIDYNKVA